MKCCWNVNKNIMEKKLYTLIVHSENIAGLLNQVTAVFTRRQINIESLNVSASSIKGVHKYTITAWATSDEIEKVVKQIEKKMDVLQAWILLGQIQAPKVYRELEELLEEPPLGLLPEEPEEEPLLPLALT